MYWPLLPEFNNYTVKRVWWKLLKIQGHSNEYTGRR